MLLVLIPIVMLFVVIGMAVILIRKQQRTRDHFASINELQSQRNDLLPDLLDIMSEEMDLQPSLKKQMLAYRSKTMARNVAIEDKIAADNELNRIMDTLMDESQHYPELRSESEYIRLTDAWNDNNEELQRARDSYNQLIKDYNYSLQSFPTNIIAKLLKYESKAAFEVQQTIR